jgi:hypothetical protein
MRLSERELEYLDEDIARLRRRISEKERAEGDHRVVNRALWASSLRMMREQLASLEDEHGRAITEMPS